MDEKAIRHLSRKVKENLIQAEAIFKVLHEATLGGHLSRYQAMATAAASHLAEARWALDTMCLIQQQETRGKS